MWPINSGIVAIVSLAFALFALGCDADWQRVDVAASNVGAAAK
jgi:hypothetical protein